MTLGKLWIVDFEQRMDKAVRSLTRLVRAASLFKDATAAQIIIPNHRHVSAVALLGD